MTKVAASDSAVIVIFAAPSTALVEAAVLGMFDMPIVAKVKSAQQGPNHGLLQSPRLPLPAIQYWPPVSPDGTSKILPPLPR